MVFEAPKGLPTVFDPAFKGCGQKPGLDIFRIEKLKVVKKEPTDKAHQGQLHEGDAYIILRTKLSPSGTALERDIFFWLGKDSSQDEQGVAAYKTVELDESLGGEPVQHREVQGHESDDFLSMFKTGVRYLEGGVATGFKHVDREAFTTRLLHIKGRRNIRTSQVPLEPSSMNDGDVFILDAGRDIFQWNGASASRVEKSKGLEITKSIRDQERGGNGKIHVIDHGKDDDTLFWQKFGKPKPAKIKPDGGDDDEHSKKGTTEVKLYHVTDASGKLAVNEVKERPLKKEMLSTNDAYVLDTGASGIYAWVGKGASGEEKASSMKYATDFIKQKGYPNHTPVTRVVEGGETPIFKENFFQWTEKDASKPGQPRKASKQFVKKTFDAKTMLKQQEREKARLVDDGKGKLEIWRIEDFEMVAWPREKYGHFYSGDSYVMLYTYLQNSKECRIIYFWQGLKSSQDEKGASALHAVALDDKYGGEPVQCRVVQNKEPQHLYLVMKQFGGMVVHEGGRASGFKNVQDQDSYDVDGTRLFQIRGTNEFNTRAIQVPEKASSLNSGDVFCLETPKNVFLWFGKNCTGDEREFAKSIVKGIVPGRGASFESVMEGKEPESFWAGLGGKGAYAESRTEAAEEEHEPRLFQCSNAKGYFYVEEVFDFDQEDLIEEDVMILDLFHEVFVWIGKEANAEEKKNALTTAIEYVKSDAASGRTVDDTSIMQVKQGMEPPNFTCNFHAWDANKWSSGKSYEELKAALHGSGDAGPEPVSVKEALKAYSSDVKYSYDDLVNNKVPENVDLTRKELYLNDADFKTYIGMSRDEFAAMPQWKQNNIKKKTRLF